MVAPLEISAPSCPGERAPQAAVVARLRANLQRTYLWGLLARSGDALERDAPELTAILARAEVDDDVAWTKTVLRQQAALVAAASGTEPDACWVAAQVGPALRDGGVEGEWRARFATPRRARYGDFVSPPIEEIDTMALDRLEARGWARLPVVDVDACALAMVPSELREICPVDAAAWKPAGQVAACESALAASLEVVRQAAPGYVDWIHDALHTIVPVDSPPGAETSMSFPNVDGVAMIGFPADAAALGELLVHEASHVLLHLIEPVSALSNLGDGREYFSPFVQKPREIRRILVGFHAFANVAAYYRRLGGVRADRWLAVWLPRLSYCHDVLAASRGLTPSGRALFEPVAAQIGL